MNELKTLIQSLPDIVGVIIVLILILNAFLWFFLPFAIYGIKKRLDRVVECLKFRI